MDKQSARRILDFLDERISFQSDPRVSGKALTGPLGGLWRYRIGDFRVVCEIQDQRIVVLVLAVGNRRDIYRHTDR